MSGRWALGFTGTRAGMTPAQVSTIRELVWTTLDVGQAVTDREVVSLHHGCCVGADQQMHHLWRLAFGKWLNSPPIYGYPSGLHQWTDPALRQDCDRTYPPRPPLKRNEAIVQATGTLIAAPGTGDEQLRSGTWATIRMAEHLAQYSPTRRLYVVAPDGTFARVLGHTGSPLSPRSLP